MTDYSILRGTGVALVTPFTASGSPDLPALGNVIDHVLKGGVEYLVSLGTTGETPVLNPDEQKAILQFTYAHVAGRVPVVVGIGGNNTQELLHALKTYPLDHATAILSASPYYSKPSQEGIIAHYHALADAAPKPIILYNIPGRTGRNMTAATTVTLARHDNIIGIKEAAGDMVQGMQIVRDTPDDFLVLSGDDALTLAQIACGFDGVISVIANALPAEFSQLVRAALSGDMQKARQLNFALLEAYDILFAENNPAGIKAFLHHLNLIENHLRLPLVPLSKPVVERMKSFFQHYQQQY